MQSNNYENFIINIVEAMLPTFHSKNICLIMFLKSEFTYYNDDGDCIRHQKHFKLIFYRPCNYTKVLLANPTGFDELYRNEGSVEYEMLCDHDSCWRDFKFIFKHWMEALDFFEEKNIDRFDPGINWHFGFDLFNGPMYHEVDYKEMMNFKYDNRTHKIKLGKCLDIKEVGPYLQEREYFDDPDTYEKKGLK